MSYKQVHLGHFRFFKNLLTLPKQIRCYISTFFRVRCECGEPDNHTTAYTYLQLQVRRHLSHVYPEMYVRSSPPSSPLHQPILLQECISHAHVSETTRRCRTETSRDQSRRNQKHYKRQYSLERQSKSQWHHDMVLYAYDDLLISYEEFCSVLMRARKQSAPGSIGYPW